ncbi:MAG: hypothetical protein ICV60_10120 [Pyrinomonadaceae bacterium]|nr:hypothetical protein [Pyrinomonadaceae bacterium]
MNNLRQLCMALVLTLTLSAVALAEGKVDCPGITQEPPTEEATVAGDIQNGVSTDTDAITQTTLTVVLVMLSVV